MHFLLPNALNWKMTNITINFYYKSGHHQWTKQNALMNCIKYAFWSEFWKYFVWTYNSQFSRGVIKIDDYSPHRRLRKGKPPANPKIYLFPIDSADPRIGSLSAWLIPRNKCQHLPCEVSSFTEGNIYSLSNQK